MTDKALRFIQDDR